MMNLLLGYLDQVNNYYVYKHTCPNGKVYIGITKQNPFKRWKNGQGYKIQSYFYKAIQKYGWENIKHEVVCEGLSKEEACNKEVELITYYKSNKREYGYNIYEGGNLGSTNIEVSEETRRKLSESHKGNNNYFYGKHHTNETVEKIKKSRIGKQWDYFKGKHHSNEFKIKKSNSMRDYYKINKHPKAKVVCQYDINGNLLKEFKSLCTAAKELNINKSKLSKVCNNNKLLLNSYWKYKEVSNG